MLSDGLNITFISENRFEKFTRNLLSDFTYTEELCSSSSRLFSLS